MSIFDDLNLEPAPMESTHREPMPIPCLHCSARQLFLVSVSCRPVQGMMEFRLHTVNEGGHEFPSDWPEGIPAVTCNFQCLACEQWSFIAVCSGTDDGSWLRFEKLM
jgi:hypothetical protein